MKNTNKNKINKKIIAKRVAKKRQEIVVQPSLLLSEKHIEDEIANFVSTLLNSDQFILPRAVPTRVYQKTFKRVITISDCVAASVLLRPSLSKPLVVTTKSAASVPGTYTVLSEDVIGCPTQGSVFWEIPFYDSGSQGTLRATQFSYPTGTAYRMFLSDVGDQHYAVAPEFPDVYGTMYPGAVTAIAGSLTVLGNNISSGSYWNLMFESRNAMGTTMGSLTAVVNVATPGQTVYTFSGVIPVAAFFSLRFVPVLDNAPAITQFNSTLSFSIDSDVTGLFYDPTDGYETLTGAAQRWSITSASLLIQNTQSSLSNGGNIYIATVTNDYPLTTYPLALSTQITTMQPQNFYNGPLRKGAFASYLPEDSSGYFFQNVVADATTDSQQLDTPKLVASIIGPTDGSSISLMVTMRINYEYIITSQVFTSAVSNNNITFLTECLGAIRACELDDDLRLVGENPDHVRKIKTIARKVAQNPRVKDAARSALRVGTEATKTLLPLLASIL